MSKTRIQTLFSSRWVSSVVLIFFMLTSTLSLVGCGGGGGGSSSGGGPTVPSSTSVSSSATGVATVQSQSGPSYEFRIADEKGVPLQGIRVDYSNVNNRNLFVFYDESGKYTSAMLYGSDAELKQHSISSLSRDKSEIVTLTIIIGITLFSIVTAELQIIDGMYKMQKFYISDVVSYDADTITYCKTGEEIANFVIGQKDVWFGAGKVGLAYLGFVSSGTKVAEGAYQITPEVIKFLIKKGANTLTDWLFDEYAHNYGKSLGQNEGRIVYYHNWQGKAGYERLVGGIDITDVPCESTPPPPPSTTADINGTWAFTASGNNIDNKTQIFTIVQTGNNFNATGIGNDGNPYSFSGTINGNSISFTVNGHSYNGNPATFTMIGTVTGNSMSGSLTGSDGTSGTWIATRGSDDISGYWKIRNISDSADKDWMYGQISRSGNTFIFSGLCGSIDISGTVAGSNISFSFVDKLGVTVSATGTYTITSMYGSWTSSDNRSGNWEGIKLSGPSCN